MKKLRQYRLLKTDGTEERITLAGKATLEELQSWVGGYIQGFRLSPRLYAFVNEDGIALGLPRNPFCASIVGNIVVCPPRCTT